MLTVNLPQGGRAYLTVTVGSSAVLATAPEYAVAALNGYPPALGWTAAAWDGANVVVAGENRRNVKVLLRGPAAPSDGTPPGALIADDSLVYVRVAGNPEILPTDPVRVNLAP